MPDLNLEKKLKKEKDTDLILQDTKIKSYCVHVEILKKCECHNKLYFIRVR